jgi:phage portal protein BeeE
VDEEEVGDSRALTNKLCRQALETAFLLAGFMKGEEVRKEQKTAREMSI